MTRASMTWEARFEDNYAIGYDEDEKPLGHKKRGARRRFNGYDGYGLRSLHRNHKELLEVAIKDTYTPWRWENYVPYNPTIGRP